MSSVLRHTEQSRVMSWLCVQNSHRKRIQGLDTTDKPQSKENWTAVSMHCVLSSSHGRA